MGTDLATIARSEFINHFDDLAEDERLVDNITATLDQLRERNNAIYRYAHFALEKYLPHK